ncbi:MAG: PIG-L family deacetylase [Pedosphaera sp.]|nr:PIG-L family deacetylase [Pedosphaera sp.]
MRPGKLFTASPRLIACELGKLSAAKFGEILSVVHNLFINEAAPPDPYKSFVDACAKFLQVGRSWPLGGFPNCPRPTLAPDAPKVLIFSPHPDDEVIIGGLALRLLREARWNVINVAVTQGSNKARQAERLAELRACCDCIGFGLIQTTPNGLEKVNVRTREQEPAHWAQSVKVIADILAQHQPRAIFFPHESDWNSSHIGTHHLVIDALKTLGPGFSCFAIETEFWGAMPSPNLMVEISTPDLGDLITALTFHVGEVKRNPYHLSLPAWMMDNVRRGGEVVGGQGGVVPDFTFATLYRLQKWAEGKLQNVFEGGRNVAAGENPLKLLS